jgi:hypothetical protein
MVPRVEDGILRRCLLLPFLVLVPFLGAILPVGVGKGKGSGRGASVGVGIGDLIPVLYPNFCKTDMSCGVNVRFSLCSLAISMDR